MSIYDELHQLILASLLALKESPLRDEYIRNKDATILHITQMKSYDHGVLVRLCVKRALLLDPYYEGPDIYVAGDCAKVRYLSAVSKNDLPYELGSLTDVGSKDVAMGSTIEIWDKKAYGFARNPNFDPRELAKRATKAARDLMQGWKKITRTQDYLFCDTKDKTMYVKHRLRYENRVFEDRRLVKHLLDFPLFDDRNTLYPKGTDCNDMIGNSNIEEEDKDLMWIQASPEIEKALKEHLEWSYT